MRTSQNMRTSQKTLSVNSGQSILVWPENPKRSYLSVQNQSTLDILVNVGATPSEFNALCIPPGEEWSPVNPPKGDIRVTGMAAAGIFQRFFTIEESN